MSWNDPKNPPDTDLTVLLRLSASELQIWPGFHDGDTWVQADGSTMASGVTGWMHLEDAAAKLDS